MISKSGQICGLIHSHLLQVCCSLSRIDQAVFLLNEFEERSQIDLLSKTGNPKVIRLSTRICSGDRLMFYVNLTVPLRAEKANIRWVLNGKNVSGDLRVCSLFIKLI